MRERRYLSGVLALLSLFCLLLVGCRTEAPEEVVPEAPELGAIAPGFALPTLGGELVSLSQLRGRPVLLNFWAIRCPPCRDELPFIQDIYEKQAGEDLFILAVNIEETESAVADFIQREGLTFPVALDPEGQAARDYRIRFIPTTFLIDRGGIVRQVKVGAFRGEDEILALLESLG